MQEFEVVGAKAVKRRRTSRQRGLRFTRGPGQTLHTQHYIKGVPRSDISTLRVIVVPLPGPSPMPQGGAPAARR